MWRAQGALRMPPRRGPPILKNMYQITVMKFEALSDEEKTERQNRDRNNDFNRGMRSDGPYPPTFPNLLERGQHKVVKVLEAELTPEEFEKVKAGVLKTM